MSNLFAQWDQKGLSLYGEQMWDEFGYSIDIDKDGDCMVVGATQNNSSVTGGGVGTGYAQVFFFEDGDWTPKGDKLTGFINGNEYGCDVAISDDGNRVVVGGHMHDNPVSEGGSTKVFEWDGTVWVQMGEAILGESVEDRLGWRVSMNADGSTVALSGPQWYFSPKGPGIVKVFDWDGTSWIQRGTTLSGEGTGDMYGSDISLSKDGNRLAIGGMKWNSSAGHVKIFEWDGSSWTQMGSTLYGDDYGWESGEGISLSADGTVVAIGSPECDLYYDFGGQIKVMQWDGTDWVPKGHPLYTPWNHAGLGTAVELSDDGNRLVGHTFSKETGLYNTGYLRVYDWNGTIWEPNSPELDEFIGIGIGRKVSISGDGKTVGAGWQSDNTIAEFAGIVKAFGDVYSSVENHSMDNDIIVYPNPFVNELYIRTGESNEVVSIQISDISGQLVFEQIIDKGQSTIDLSKLNSGIYILRVENEQFSSKKVIVKE